MRGQVGIIVEAGDVWEVHHYACLIGFGATAINPYLAFATIHDVQNNRQASNRSRTRTTEEKLYKSRK